MDIVKRIGEVEENFSQLMQVIEQKKNEIMEIEDELKRLQGEHRLLLLMKQEVAAESDDK